jgi:hypothetical protein
MAQQVMADHIAGITGKLGELVEGAAKFETALTPEHPPLSRSATECADLVHPAVGTSLQI